MAVKRECDIFCCYRGKDSNTATGGAYGLSEFLAKEFSNYIEKKNKENKNDGTIKKLKCHFSKDKRDGNYWGDIKPLIESAKYFLVFLFDGFTEGFLDEEDIQNESCVTAREFVTAEKARQNGRLNIMTLNISGKSFSAKDAERLEKLFRQNNCYWEEDNKDKNLTTPRNSVTEFIHSSHNNYYVGNDDSREAVFEEIRKTIEIKLGKGYEYKTSKNGISLLKYCGEDTDVTTPEEINGKKVIAFEPSTFAGNAKIKKITFSVGIRVIKNYSFSECESLNEINIPITVENIESDAFENGNFILNLERVNQKINYSGEINFSYNNINTDKEFDYVLHGNNAYLTRCKYFSNTIDIPATIGYYEVVYIANIFEKADNKLNEDIEEINLPDSICYIDCEAFRCLSNLQKINIDNGNENYYSKNNSLIKTSTKTIILGLDICIIPRKVQNIAPYAFINLKEISFENDSRLVKIGFRAFYNCTNLTHIEIPSSVTKIAGWAFEGCNSLKNISIPSSVSCIDHGVFEGCNSLISIDIQGSITSIGDFAFNGCNSLSSIEIPESVISIGSVAFKECHSLANISLPSSITSVGDGAFEDCSQLQSIKISNSLTEILEWTFYKCSNLKKIELPSGLTSIGEFAFAGCSDLTGIEIPSGVTSIGMFAFRDCGNLTIYCEAESQPSGWDDSWNIDNRPVIWGHKIGAIEE